MKKTVLLFTLVATVLLNAEVFATQISKTCALSLADLPKGSIERNHVLAVRKADRVRAELQKKFPQLVERKYLRVKEQSLQEMLFRFLFTEGLSAGEASLRLNIPKQTLKTILSGKIERISPIYAKRFSHGIKKPLHDIDPFMTDHGRNIKSPLSTEVSSQGSPESLQRIVLQAISDQGGTARQAATSMDISYCLIRDIISGRRSVTSSENLVKLSRFTGKPLDPLKYGLKRGELEKNPQTLGAYLRNFLKTRNMTAIEAAKLSGVDIWIWKDSMRKNRERTIRLIDAKLLSHFTRIPLIDLIPFVREKSD